jgi:hypothetical protein
MTLPLSPEARRAGVSIDSKKGVSPCSNIERGDSDSVGSTGLASRQARPDISKAKEGTMKSKQKTKGPDLLSFKVQNKIRKAFRAGRRKITIGDHTFNITREDKDVNFMAGGELHSQKESWLVVTLSDSFTPRASFELEEQGNLRSRF